jgi:hypothetical protein
MKFIIVLLCPMYVLSGWAQIEYPAFDRRDSKNCDITRIELNSQHTIVYFKYLNQYQSGAWACAGPDFYIRDYANNRYKLRKAVNIPICPDVYKFEAGKNYIEFSLVFDPLPKNAEKIDIIESDTKPGFNFYGVYLNPNAVKLPENASINAYNGVQRTTEAQQPAASNEPKIQVYYKDGRAFQYYLHNGISITMHLYTEKTYGKYYVAYIAVENLTGHSFNFNPDEIRVTLVNNDKIEDGQILSYYDYMKKVNRRQAWQAALMAWGESSSASNAGYSYSRTTSSASGYVNSYGNASGYYGDTYGSVSGSSSTYGTVSGTSTTVTYDGAQNYAAQQVARQNIAAYQYRQYQIRQEINDEYLKLNTIDNEQRLKGQVNINFKKAAKVRVTVPVDGVNYDFWWNSN